MIEHGTVLVGGGTNGSSTLATAEFHDPTAGIFLPTGGMVSPRQSHTANLLNDGMVHVTGGTYAAVLVSA